MNLRQERERASNPEQENMFNSSFTIRIEGSILVAFEAGWFNVVAGGLSEVTKYLEV